MSESIRELEAVLGAFIRADEHIRHSHDIGEKVNPEAYAERAYAALFIARHMASRERSSATEAIARMRGQEGI